MNGETFCEEALPNVITSVQTQYQNKSQMGWQEEGHIIYQLAYCIYNLIPINILGTLRHNSPWKISALA